MNRMKMDWGNGIDVGVSFTWSCSSSDYEDSHSVLSRMFLSCQSC